MDIIKVSAIDSTNSLGRKMFKDNPKLPLTCIVAQQQWKGRGQRGTHWQAQTGKNLTFSLVLPHPGVSVKSQFLISAQIASSLVLGLNGLGIPRLKLKWPNDIMSGNFKIAGILIENIIAEGELAASIIGIGLNVNQTDFQELPDASSLKLVTGQEFSLEELLSRILESLEPNFQALPKLSAEEILRNYQDNLFRKNIPSTFQLPDGTFFMGIIQNVRESGKLQVKTEDDRHLEFELKEVKLCY